MKFMSKLFYAATTALLFATIPESLKGEAREITILQTADIHCHITAETSGALRLASLIKQQQQQHGGSDKTLLIDCGDTIAGTLIASRTQGKAAVKLLNHCEFDIWVPGNHELEFGIDRFLVLARQVNADVFSANFAIKEKFPFKKWKLYRKNGIKIAFIGMNSAHLKQWLWEEKLQKTKVLSISRSLEQIMPEIMAAKTDIIILGIHQGRFNPQRLQGEQLAEIARKYPQINLILGAHSHVCKPGQPIGYNTWYVQPGAHAEFLAVIKIRLKHGINSLPQISSELLPVTEDIPEDAKLREMLNRELNDTRTAADEIIGSTKTTIVPSADNTSDNIPISQLFCKAIIESTNAAAVFHGNLNNNKILSGNITGKDLFDAIPYEDRICTLLLNKKEFLLILQEQLRLRKLGRFQTPGGIRLLISSHNKSLSGSNGTEAPRSISIINTEKNLFYDQNDRIKIGLSSYVMAGAGGRFPILKKLQPNRNAKQPTLKLQSGSRLKITSVNTAR